MENWILRLNVLLACAFLVSCASERTVTYEKGETEQFGDRYMSEVEYEQDAEGNWLPTKGSDKRSSYEGNSYAGSKGYKGQNYSTDSYRKKRWGGDDKGYKTKSYAGKENAQFYQKPYFVKQANAQGQSAAGINKGYSTGNYAGSPNKVNKGTSISRTTDAKVSNKKATSPSKLQDYYKKDGDYIMGIDDTNALMGR